MQYVDEIQFDSIRVLERVELEQDENRVKSDMRNKIKSMQKQKRA